MTLATADKPQTIITRHDPACPILAVTPGGGIAIRAGTVIEAAGRSHTFTAETPIDAGMLLPGRDYAVDIDEDGRPYVEEVDTDPVMDGWAAGFHFAPGGNAEGRAGGDKIPAINRFSFWDVGFRPACDPRGMTRVTLPDGRAVWVDIYLLGTRHKAEGTSRHGAEIADGRSLSLLDHAAAQAICAEHGKRLMTYDEFRAAAFGVTEKSSAPRDPGKTGLDATHTSAFGLMQATGNMWIWGTDGDPDDPRPSLFGGSWFGGSSAGSRYADLGYFWPGYSGGSLGARAACDPLMPV